MKESDREICQRAFAVIDAVDGQAEQQAYEEQAAADDAYLAGLQRRREQAESQRLVMKTYVTPAVEGSGSSVADDDIQRRLEMLASIIGGEVGRTQTEIMQTLRAEIAQLGAELRSELRAEIALQNVMPQRRAS